ncbi:MAG TPA: dihydroneopterin aldolase [Chitinophagaceae bacterium]|nr:dihydroneopterin aldolase [Chitinophagaceae bacterium]
MITVSLEKMRFYSHQGLHPEERITGNSFEVSVQAEWEGPEEPGNILSTVDYEKVYELVEKVMSGSQMLLEEMAHQISVSLRQNFPRISGSEIRVCKLNPPLSGQAAQACITIRKKY